MQYSESQFEWMPEAPAYRRFPGAGEAPVSPTSNHSSPRRVRKTHSYRATWSTEKVFLAIAFFAALVFGYVASTLLWQLDVLGELPSTFSHEILWQEGVWI